MKLVSYLQNQIARIELGGRTQSPEEKDAAARESEAQAAEDLRQVQRTNDRYFKGLWLMMMIAFVVTFVFALVYRNEMGGLPAVLGGGGVAQGGLLLRLSSEYKQKAYIDLVATLSQRLPPKELKPVLQQILDLLRKDAKSAPEPNKLPV